MQGEMHAKISSVGVQPSLCKMHDRALRDGSRPPDESLCMCPVTIAAPSGCVVSGYEVLNPPDSSQQLQSHNGSYSPTFARRAVSSRIMASTPAARCAE